MRQTSRMILFCVIGLSVAAGSIGCGGDDQVPVYPASGSILVDGQPAPYATIMLIPNDTSGEMELLRPHAKADAQGRFALSTYGRDDGAPAGDYKVTIAWHGPPPGFDAADLSEEEMTSGPDRLGGKYDDSATTTLTASISEGDNQIPPFELNND